MEITELSSWLEGRASDLISLRRTLHAHPELSGEEHRTGSLVAELLEQAGLEVRRGLAGTGVLATVKGKTPGRNLLIRADMDALPIQEENDIDYCSTVPGVMHACGHDGHTAVAAIVATALAAHAHLFEGSVRFAFQPAEEKLGGAERMIAHGAMDDPPVDGVLSFHLWNYLPTGKLGVRGGPIFACADELEIVVRGKGGHGALPHEAVDAVVAASHVVVALQALVSREVSPFESAVLTLGTINGGRAFNIIAEEVKITGTLRTFSDAVRSTLLRRCREMTAAVATAMRCAARVEVKSSCPPVINDLGMVDLVRRAASVAVGEGSVDEVEASTGADDVAYFLQRAPGCYFLVGSSPPGEVRPHHSPYFDIDERALLVAAKVLAAAAVMFLKEGRRA
jgi:amidohydrolase